MKKIVKGAVVGMAALFCLAVLLFGGLLVFLTIAEYRPAATEPVRVEFAIPAGEMQFSDARQPVPAPPLPRLQTGVPFSVLSWNIGYASLDASQDFIMDGGKNVRPATGENVMRNIAGISETIAALNCDIVLLQEVDTASRRSYYVNQVTRFAGSFNGSSAFALNFRSLFVPIPFPEFIGRVSSGLLTLNAFETAEAARISLPNPFSWPVRAANLKRCLLVSRLPLAGSDACLVLVNLHLEAYDSSGGREAQTKAMLDFLYAEYAKGNYCIAGGDFNQNFPGIDPKRFAVKNSDFFIPGELSPSLLSPLWRFAADPDTPGARLLNEPYSGRPDETQLYIIDGFIISPNVKLVSVRTIDMGFRYSDHHPVKIEALLE